MAIKTIRVFAEYTSDGYVPMPSQGNIDYGITIGNSFPETQPSSYQTDDPNIDVAVNTMTDFYVWIRTHGSPWNPSYTRVVRVYPDSPSINSVVMNMIVAVGSGGTSINSGGGVTYYLNGGTSQGILDGSTYYEMSKTPVQGAMVDFFKINTTGFENIAQFVTDAGDPSLLKIPPGAWPLGFYFSASDNSGSPKFYAEIYKYSNTGVFTLLGSSVASAEVISNGVAIDYYTTTVTIPDTTLLITDRIAIRIFVDTDGNRTVNFHTQDSHLASVGTTFANGLTAINGLTKQVQFIAIGNSGSDAAIVSSDDTHTINLPTASATKRGILSSTDWSTFNAKQAALSGTGFVKIDGSTIIYDNSSYQPLDGDLTAIGALAGTTGILKKTGANTWELDTTTYLSTGVAASTYQRLDKMVSNLLASDTEYPNSNAVLAKLALKANAENPEFTGYMTIGGAYPKIYLTDSDNNPDYFIGNDDGYFRIYDQTNTVSRFYITSLGVSTFPGSVIVGSIAKSGGLSTEFLKADGTVDSNTYATSGSLSNYLLSATAASTYQRLDKMVSNLLASSTEYPNSNAVLAKLALKADAANPVFTGDMTISGIAPKLYFTDTDNNPDYTLFVDSGYFYIYDQTAGATRFQITPSGNAINTGTLTSASFIKSGGTSSQYLMADGSVTTLTNPVTGSGTTNYLPKWTSGSALGNSLVFDTGTNVGINTASPATILHVNGGIAMTGGWNKTTTFQAQYPTLIFNSNASKWGAIGYDYSNAMTFWVNGTSDDVNGTGTVAMQILNSGATVFQKNLAINGLSIDNDIAVAAKAPAGIGKFTYVGRDSSSVWNFSVASSGDTLIGYGQSGAVYKLLTLSSSGNSLDTGTVLRLIGNSALDLVDISVKDTITRIYHQENAADAANGYGLIQFRTNAVSYPFAPTRGGFLFTINTTDALAINNTGFVGVNTTAPAYRFSVVAGSEGAVSIQKSSATVGNPIIDIYDAGRSQESVISSTDGTTTGTYIAAYSNHPLMFGSNAGSSPTNKMIIFANGNTAINTSIDSGFKFNVNGTGRFVGDLQLGDYSGNPTLTFAAANNGINKINFYDQNNTEGLYIRTDGETYGGTMTFGARWDDDEAKIVFKMYQTSAGAGYNARVGIGTTDPSGELTVKRNYSSSFTPAYIGNSSYTAWNRQTYDTFILQQDDVTSFRMVEKNGETTGADQVLTFSVGDGLARIATSAVPLQFFVNGSPSGLAYQGLSGTAAMTILTSGYVGILTTSPLAPIHATGGTTMTGGWNRTAMIGATFPVFVFNSNTTKYAGLGYDYSGSGQFILWVNATSENVPGSGTQAFNIANSGAAWFSSSITATSFFESSDFRLKKLIESNPIIDKIEKLETKLYEKNGKLELGYFAQDAEKIMPYAVTKNADGFLNLSYREVHTAKIARLEKRVAELEKQLNLN